MDYKRTNKPDQKQNYERTKMDQKGVQMDKNGQKLQKNGLKIRSIDQLYLRVLYLESVN